MLLKEQLQIGQNALYCYWDQNNNNFRKKSVQILWIYDNETAEVKYTEGFKVELVPLSNLCDC